MYIVASTSIFNTIQQPLHIIIHGHIYSIKNTVCVLNFYKIIFLVIEKSITIQKGSINCVKIHYLDSENVLFYLSKSVIELITAQL